MKERLQQLSQSLLAAARQIAWKQLLPRLAVVVLTTLVGLWIMFPVDALLELVRRKAGTNLSIDYADAHMGLAGPVVEDLRVAGVINLYLEQAQLRPGLSTLWFKPAIYAGGELGNGWLWLESGLSSVQRPIAFAADELNVLKAGLGQNLFLGLNLSGSLSALGDFIYSNNPADITGAGWIVIDQPHLSGDIIPLASKDIAFKKMQLEVKINAGMLTIERFAIDGDDMWGTIRGSIELERRLSLSKADLRMEFHFSQALDNAIGPLLSLAGFRKEKDAYVKQYRGPLNRIRG